MRRVCLPGLAGLLGLALMASGTAFAADQQAAAKADAAKKTETKTTETTTKTETHTANKPVAGEAASTEVGRRARRLPSHFGQIGLSAEQRQQVKAVEDKYAGEIKELETKLKEVRAKQMSEMHALLSEAQKKALSQAHAAAAKIREERKAITDKAMAAGADRVKEVKARFLAEQKKIQEGLAKRHAEHQEKEKALKEKAAEKEATKKETKEEQKAAEKTDKK